MALLGWFLRQGNLTSAASRSFFPVDEHTKVVRHRVDPQRETLCGLRRACRAGLTVSTRSGMTLRTIDAIPCAGKRSNPLPGSDGYRWDSSKKDARIKCNGLWRPRLTAIQAVQSGRGYIEKGCVREVESQQVRGRLICIAQEVVTFDPTPGGAPQGLVRLI